MGFLIKLIKYINHVFIWGTWERQAPWLSHSPELRKGSIANSYSENGKKRNAKIQGKVKEETKKSFIFQNSRLFLPSFHTCEFVLGKFELEWKWKKRRLVGDWLSQRLTPQDIARSMPCIKMPYSATRFLAFPLAHVKERLHNLASFLINLS